MLFLSNDQLEVSILDPVQDQARLGARYCTGGYVYAVHDRRLGVVTSGPGFPDEEYPPVFDGQGLPEAFPSPLWPGVDSAAPTSLPAPGTTMLLIGVGLVQAPASGLLRELSVQEFCHWSISQTPDRLRMETRHAFANWAVELTRDVSLINRSLISETRLANVGQDSLAFRWFPHPFFPHPHGECCRFNLPVSFPENPGYTLLANGFVATRDDRPWDRRGHFQALTFTPGERLVALQRHPKLGLVAATCSYTPSYFPIWGNRNCFSFEPYLEQQVAPGSEATWSVAYDF